MKLLNIINKCNEILKREGATALAKNFFLSSIRALTNYRTYFCYEKYWLFEKRLDGVNDSLSISLARNANLNIVSTSTQIDKLISEGYDFRSCPAFENLKDGLEKGTMLFFVFIRKEYAHSSMVAMDSDNTLFDPIFQKIRFQGAGYIGPCYTNPLYRGMGIYPYVLSKSCEFLKGKGKTKALINTKKNNEASIKGITKAGFIFVSEVRYLKMLFWKFYKMNVPKEPKEALNYEV